MSYQRFQFSVILDNCIEIVPKQTPEEDSDFLKSLPSKLISLAEASERTGLSASHIRKLVREGEIKGVKLGRNWLTTEEAVREYLKQDRRPGPK